MTRVRGLRQYGQRMRALSWTNGCSAPDLRARLGCARYLRLGRLIIAQPLPAGQAARPPPTLKECDLGLVLWSFARTGEPFRRSFIVRIWPRSGAIGGLHRFRCAEGRRGRAPRQSPALYPLQGTRRGEGGARLPSGIPFGMRSAMHGGNACRWRFQEWRPPEGAAEEAAMGISRARRSRSRGGRVEPAGGDGESHQGFLGHLGALNA